MQPIGRQLGQIGFALARDPIIRNRYAGELQALDRSQQLLSDLAVVTGAENKARAVERIARPELRARLARKALYPE